jgi:hypothetical protein
VYPRIPLCALYFVQFEKKINWFESILLKHLIKQLYFFRIQPNLPFRSRYKRLHFHFEWLYGLLVHRKFVILEERRQTHFGLHQTESHPYKSKN